MTYQSKACRRTGEFNQMGFLFIPWMMILFWNFCILFWRLKKSPTIPCCYWSNEKMYKVYIFLDDAIHRYIYTKKMYILSVSKKSLEILRRYWSKEKMYKVYIFLNDAIRRYICIKKIYIHSVSTKSLNILRQYWLNEILMLQ